MEASVCELQQEGLNFVFWKHVPQQHPYLLKGSVLLLRHVALLDCEQQLPNAAPPPCARCHLRFDVAAESDLLHCSDREGHLLWRPALEPERQTHRFLKR